MDIYRVASIHQSIDLFGSNYTTSSNLESTVWWQNERRRYNQPRTEDENLLSMFMSLLSGRLFKYEARFI